MAAASSDEIIRPARRFGSSWRDDLTQYKSRIEWTPSDDWTPDKTSIWILFNSLWTKNIFVNVRNFRFLSKRWRKVYCSLSPRHRNYLLLIELKYRGYSRTRLMKSVLDSGITVPIHLLCRVYPFNERGWMEIHKSIVSFGGGNIHPNTVTFRIPSELDDEQWIMLLGLSEVHRIRVHPSCPFRITKRYYLKFPEFDSPTFLARWEILKSELLEKHLIRVSS